MELISSIVQSYVTQFSSEPNELLHQVLAHTQANHAHAHMISGHEQGRLLAGISKIKSPQNILEIGTFTGYSALCLLEGLKEDGALHTIEIREEDARTSQQFFDQHPKGKSIQLHVGNAKDIIPTLELQWDIVFIDADKVSYIDYYELVVPRLAKGGLIIADNVLFHGQVLEEPITGKNAKAIHKFNEWVKQDERTEQVLLTMRDGLLLIWKK